MMACIAKPINRYDQMRLFCIGNYRLRYLVSTPGGRIRLGSLTCHSIELACFVKCVTSLQYIFLRKMLTQEDVESVVGALI